MKKLLLLAIAASVLANVPAVSSAANIKMVMNKNQNKTYQGIKMPEGVTVYNNNPKALFAAEGKKDVRTALLDAGATSANVYTLNIKNGNEMNYAVYADVVLGRQLTGVMGESRGVSTDSSTLGALVSSINSGNNPVLGTFTVVAPLSKQGNAYEGTLKHRSTVNNNSYEEVLHVMLFEDKYTGPNARFIAIDAESDAKIFPKVKELLQSKTK